MHTLLVHPDPIIVAFLWEALTSQGREIEAVNNGNKARLRLKKGGVDCVITMMDMETYSGFDVLREAEAQDEIPCLVIHTSSKYGEFDLENDLEKFHPNAELYVVDDDTEKLCIAINNWLKGIPGKEE